MAPKKKGGRKKEEAPKEPEIDDAIVPEHSREFYLIQIRDLERRLARYQKRWDELQVSEELFRSEYEKMLHDNKEIVAFLKKTLNQRIDEIADLSDQLQHLQHAKDMEKDAFEAQLAQLRHEFQETKDQLMSENMVLSGKLAALEEFRIQKHEILAKFAELEGQLKKQEEDHKEVIYHLEKKAVLDKERLKKEMLHRVNAVAAEFRKVSNSQMAETTKRTIRENVTISLQLTKITEQSLQLLQENDQLKAANAEVLKQVQLLEQNEKKLAKNSLSNQKMIVMLTDKCKELQEQVDKYAKQKKVMEGLQEANEELEQRNLVLREELNMQKEELQRRVSSTQDQERALREERQRRMTAERVLRHAAQGLEEVMFDRPSIEEQEGRFDVMYHLRRNDMLQGVMRDLNKGVTQIEENLALRPYLLETKLVKMTASTEDGRSRESFMRLKASRFMSHCNLFKIPKPLAIHSMPSLGRFARKREEVLRPYSSATEPLMTVYREKSEEEVKSPEKEVLREDPGLPETVAVPSKEEQVEG
ncbi:cilia- and flagella-associated protein 157 [Hemicordylus capensis]|uniref:cilia- and flagella-associated protein 157 n=1 Tax=Hemicordylus capensis TaxID=884348 RepID=UPI002304B3EE|nr:cilia- and flagella-associated protein 157 [Hemicordylus capensis]